MDNPAPESAAPVIGIVTALPKEYAAVKAMLQNIRKVIFPGFGGGRQYLLGKMPAAMGGMHPVVLTLAAEGNNIATARATLLLERFPSVKSVIMVGIAGGVPNPNKPDEHVRLGDIVVSDQKGIVQYDFTKEEVNEIIPRHPPRPSDPCLLDSVNLLKAAEMEGKRPWVILAQKTMRQLKIRRPSEDTDFVVNSNNSNEIVPHPPDPKRKKGQPRVFVGTIASANRLLKNPVKRDELRDRFGVKAIEMEGSGIADATWDHKAGFLVIRGICDYCDKNKGVLWQNYAAVVAAAYTRAMLGETPVWTLETGVLATMGGAVRRARKAGRKKNVKDTLNYQMLLDACARQVENEVRYLKGNSSRDRRKKYIPDLYVTRVEIEGEFEEFLKQQEKNSCVIVGEAGIGKTNLLCHLSEKLAKERPVFFFNSRYINEPLGEHIAKIFKGVRGLSKDFDTLIADISKTLHEKDIDLIVFIDAINESPNPSKMKNDLAELVHRSIGSKLKFYISCRDMDWEFFLKNNDMFLDCLYSKRGREFLRNDVRFNQFNMKEFREAWKLYKREYTLKGTLSSQLRKICMHPLMLRFLAEGFEGQNLPIDVRRIEIFDQYWFRKLEHTETEDRAREYMFKIVQELKNKRKSELPKTEVVRLLGDTTESIQSVLSKILSENLVTYLNWKGERVVGFAYEAFLEYVMARWIIYGKQFEWSEKSKDEILSDLKNFINEAKEYRTLKGAIQYLVMMMEGEKDNIQVSLLDELMATKDPAWHSFIISVAYKLKYPERILEIIGTLAAKGDFRLFAVRALGDIGGEMAIHYLKPALKDNDYEVWNEAIASLVRVGNMKAMKSLVSALGTTRELGLKHSIVKTLSGIMKGPDIVPVLLEMTIKCDSFTKRYIIEILGGLHDKRAIEFLLKALDEEDEMTIASAAEALRDVLLSSEDTWRIWNESVTDALIGRLNNTSSSVKTSVADALGYLMNRRAVIPLLRLLSDEDRRVRGKALEALGMIGDENAIMPIIDFLGKDDDFLRKSAIVSLGLIGSQKSIPILVQTLTQEEPQNRRCIHEALKILGSDASLEALLATIEKDKIWSQRYVIEAIGSLENEAGIRPLLRLLSNIKAEVYDEFTKEEIIETIIRAIEQIGGSSGIRALTNLLQKKDRILRLSAIDSLGRMRARSALRNLTELAKSSDSDIRAHSILALGRIGDSSVRDFLIAALRTANEEIRSAIAAALGNIGGEQVVSPLNSLLEDKNKDVRSAAAKSLGILKSGRATTPLLRSLATEREESVRIYMIRALGDIGSAGAVPLLLNILETRVNAQNSETLGEAIRSLGKIGSTKATSTLIELLHASNDNVRKVWRYHEDLRLEIAEAFGAIGDSAAVSPLAELLKELGRRRSRKRDRNSRYEEQRRESHEKAIKRAARDALMKIVGKDVRV